MNGFSCVSALLLVSLATLAGGCRTDDDQGSNGSLQGGPAGAAGASVAPAQAAPEPRCDEACRQAHRTPEGEAAAPPEADPSAPQAEGQEAVFAFRKVYLGERDWQGIASDEAWKQYGLDLDGYRSDKGFSGHCKPRGSGKAERIRVDGVGGLDNGFGSGLLPMLTTISADVSGENNLAISSGKQSTLIRVRELGAGASYGGLGVEYFGKVLGGSGPVGEGAWASGASVWRPLAEGLSSQAPLAAAVQSTSAYLAQHTLVFQADELRLELRAWGQPVPLTIRRAVVVAPLDPTHRSIRNGIVAGILDAEEMASLAATISGALSPSLCDPSSTEAIADEARGAADIMLDGTQDQDKVCDGISIGIGFDADRATLGEVGESPAPPAGPCGL